MAAFEKSRRIFSFIRLINTISGLSLVRTMITQSGTSRCVIIIYNFVAVLAEISISILLLRFAVTLYNSRFATSQFWEAFTPIFYIIIQNMHKTAVLYMNRKEIDEYFVKLDEISYISEEFLKFWDENYKKIKKTGKLMLLIPTCIIIPGIMLMRLVLPPQYSKFPVIYHWEDVDWVRHFYFILDGINAGFSITRPTIMDLTIISFIKFHAVQQKYLKEQLRSIFLDLKDLKEVKIKLNHWFQLHQDSYRQIDRLKKIYGPFFFATYAYSLINVVCIMFFYLAEGEMRLFQKLAAVATFSFCLFFMGWFCRVIDELNDEIQDLPHQLDLEKIIQTKSFKNEYLILTTRASKQIKFTAMGWFNLSSKGFREVVSGSFSIFTTFYQLQNK